MCCATKASLINVILWLISLIGLAPLTAGWVDTFEQWVGHDQAVQPAIYTYASAESYDLRAFVFSSEEEDGARFRPAIVTGVRATTSQSAIGDLYSVCSDRAELGYVAIAFEMLSEQDGVSEEQAVQDGEHAAVWLVKNADDLHIDVSRTAAIAFEGQPSQDFLLGLSFGNDDSSEDNSLPVIPAGIDRFPEDLQPFLPLLL